MNDRIKKIDRIVKGTVAQWMERFERDANPRTCQEWIAELAMAQTRHRCDGLALAWANHRAKQRPRSLWALFDDEDGKSISALPGAVFWSLEHALADRAANGEKTAEVRPCELAFPTGKDLLEAVWEFIDGACDGIKEVAAWSNYSRSDTDICELRLRHEDEPDPIADLARRFAAVFRQWVLDHDGGSTNGAVSWGAWRFVGDARRFEVYAPEPLRGKSWIVAGGVTWLELCSKAGRHVHHRYAHRCTLPLGHSGDCVTEIKP